MLSGNGRKVAESEKKGLMERKERSGNRKELSITLLTPYAVITFSFCRPDSDRSDPSPQSLNNATEL